MANVLIIEDDPANLDYLRTVLASQQHTVTEAHDGLEGPGDQPPAHGRH